MTWPVGVTTRNFSLSVGVGVEWGTAVDARAIIKSNDSLVWLATGENVLPTGLVQGVGTFSLPVTDQSGVWGDTNGNTYVIAAGENTHSYRVDIEYYIEGRWVAGRSIENLVVPTGATTIDLDTVITTTSVNSPETISFPAEWALDQLDNYVLKTTQVNGHALSGNIGITKGDVGLGNVDNTSDVNKPISTATQAALNLKQGKVTTGTTATAGATAAKTATIAGYTPAAGDILALTLTNGNSATSPTININGGGATAIWLGGVALGSMQATNSPNAVWLMFFDGTQWNIFGAQNNFSVSSTAEMQAGTVNSVRWMTPAMVKDAILALAPVSSVAGRTGAVVLTKTDVGLANVDNTSDVNKPVSTATKLAISMDSPLYNGDFELQSGSVPDGWAVTGTGTSTVTVDSTNSITGTKCVKVANADASSGGQISSSIFIPVAPGEQWNVEGYFKASIATATGLYYRAFFFTSTGAASATPFINVCNNLPFANTWTYKEGIVTVPSDAATMQIVAYAWTNTGGAYDGYIDRLAVRKVLSKSLVGLSNVDNTSDVNKPVSTATTTALNGKVDKSTATTKGDLLVATAASTLARLGVGTNGQVLTADSSQASGVKWASSAGGGGNQAALSWDFAAGAIRGNVPRRYCTINSATGLSSGRMYFEAVYYEAGETVTNISWAIGSSGGSVLTNTFFALYNASLTKLGVTGNDASVSHSANTVKTLALTSPVVIPSSGLYYHVVGCTGTAIPNFMGLSSSAVITGLAPILCGMSSDTGINSAASAPATAGALTAGASHCLTYST